mgnify:CR=1 FL=1|jgi:hypothetical protein
MAKATMVPLQEGEQITAAKINELYDNTTGLTTTVDNIVGDQVRKEGLTRRVINTATSDNVKDSSAAAGWGHPWVQVNYFRIDQNSASQTITGITRQQLARTAGTYELNLNNYCVAFNDRTSTTPHDGDIVVVEWTATVTVEGKLTTVNSDAAGTYVTGQNYYTDFAQFDIQAQVQYGGVGSDLQTGGVDFPGTRPKIGSFISCNPLGAGAFTIGNENISPTEGFTTGGMGSARSVRMTAIYMIRGSETQLVFSVHCKPGVYGTAEGTVAMPTVLINDDNFTATVYRKGVEKV